jgi:multiple sugar transport system substrate-binding protein
LARTFELAYPDIAVEIQSPTNDNQYKDCFAGSLYPNNPINREKVFSLAPLLDQEASSYLDDFDHLDAFRAEGVLWALPLQAHIDVVYYNKALFDQAGLPYPDTSWTWETFEEMARALTNKNQKANPLAGARQYGYASRERGNVLFDWLLYISAHGISLWNAQGEPQFDDLAVVEATEQYFQFVRDVAQPIIVDDELDGLLLFESRDDLVQQGSVAMWLDNTSPRLRPWTESIDYGVVSLPRAGESAGVTEFTHTGLYISADTTSPQACWQWLKYVSENFVPSAALPARRSITASEQFTSRVGEDMAAVFQASARYKSLFLPDDWSEQALEILPDVLAEIWTGTSATVAFERAQDQVNK